MKPFQRIALLALALVLGLAGCAAGPEMPMEATIDGHTITLGRTTMADMADWGYEVNSAGRQDAAYDDDKYIYFHYSLSKGAGEQFWVSVYTPYYGGTNINKEAGEAAQSGIVFAVTLSKSATEKISAVYNGVDVKDMSFDTVKEWGFIIFVPPQSEGNRRCRDKLGYQRQMRNEVGVWPGTGTQEGRRQRCQTQRMHNTCLKRSAARD